MSFSKTVISYSFFEELIDFIEIYWKKKKAFLPWILFHFSKVKSKPKVEI